MDGLGALAINRDNANLVRAATAGDRAAFDQLMELHAGQVYRLALRMLGNREEAEDVQQDTFVQAFRRLRNFRGEAPFRAWVCAIAARNCLMRMRRSSRRPEQAPEEVAAYASAGLDVHEQVGSLALAARVQRALAALSPPDRLLIVLKYVEQFSHEQIAQVLGCSVESSRSRLLRAKRLFREHYQRMES